MAEFFEKIAELFHDHLLADQRGKEIQIEMQEILKTKPESLCQADHLRRLQLCGVCPLAKIIIQTENY